MNNFRFLIIFLFLNIICCDKSIEQQKKIDNELLDITLYDLKYEAINKLVKKGANVNVVDDNGNNILMKIVFINEDEAYLIAKFLISKGIYIDAKNKDGLTALMLASRYYKLKLVKLLIEKKADVNLKDNKNWTALKYAEDLKQKRVLIPRNESDDILVKIINILKSNETY